MMASSTFLRRFLLAGPALLLLLTAAPAPAAACCSSATPGTLIPDLMPRPGFAALTEAAGPALPFAFRAPAVAKGLPKSVDQPRQFDYRLRHHLWVMGGVHTVPTGLPLTAETSYADRTTFSQAGLGLGYMVSPSLRAISNWNTGLNASSVSRGGQLTLGVTWRY